MNAPPAPTVEHYMTREVLAVSESDPLLRVFQSMMDDAIHHYPVVDRQRRVVGIVSDRDLLRALAGDLVRGDPIRVIMSREVVTVRPHTPAREAVALLIEHGFNALPVVDDAGALVGIVTTRDFLRVAEGALGGG